MANEAVCYETPTRFARYQIGTGSAVSKGAILKLLSPNTCDNASADNDVFAGIAWMEKSATDGTTEIVAALDGVWGITGSASASITVGNQLSIAGTNIVKVYSTLDDEKGYAFGKALQTTAGGEVIKVRLNE